MLLIDLKDSYLSGSVAEIASAVGGAFGGRKGTLAKDVIDCLLTNQFVSSKYHPSRCWQVVQGSGISLVHSGEVVDRVFFSIVERIASEKGFLQKHGIKHYWRYRDDLLLLGNSAAGLRALMLSGVLSERRLAVAVLSACAVLI